MSKVKGKSGILLLSVIVLFTTQVSAQKKAVQNGDYETTFLGTIKHHTLREASGLAQSTRAEDLLWSHNDSGYGPYLFAFDFSGQRRGRFLIEHASSRDWEDMSSFRWQGKSWLIVADTGDNSATKEKSVIHVIAEPSANDNSVRRIRRIKPSWTINFKYPEGPADCESIAVDVVNERIFLLTKRQNPPRLYSLPLQPDAESGSTVIASLEGDVKSVPRPTARELLDYPKFGMHRSQPTAMDFASDGSHALVNTYGYAYRYDRAEDQTWLEALNNIPTRIVVPEMKQSEAVAISVDNVSVFLTSEGKDPPIFQLRPIQKKAEVMSEQRDD